MKHINERPVCHRAEDLVTYLYNEANEAEARDFANHVQACDACRAELAVFKQVHESISLWRNEALGSSFSAEPLPLPLATEAAPVTRPVRRLSAFGAFREFFSVSPLWLRGATAFAALMLCVLAVVAVSRWRNQPSPLAINQPQSRAYSKEQFDAAVESAVQSRMEALKNKNTPAGTSSTSANGKADEKDRSTQVAVNRKQPKMRPRGLTRQEREQLAADLRLIPRDEDDLPLFSEEPNQ